MVLVTSGWLSPGVVSGFGSFVMVNGGGLILGVFETVDHTSTPGGVIMNPGRAVQR